VTKELSSRLLVSIIGIPFLIWVFYSGGIILRTGLGLLTALGMWEYRKILFKDKSFWVFVDIILAVCVYLSTSLFIKKMCPTCLIPNWVYISFFFALQTIAWLARKTVDHTLKDYFLTIWGLFYIAVLTGLIFRIDSGYHDGHLLLLLVILIWITDSAAYFIGMRFGKHRGIFPMSPKKSMEGFLAGLVAPFFVVFIIYAFYPKWSMQNLIIAAICAGLFGQLGDLLESKLKRIGCVKDSSDIIPGHGGILDRFDSLLVAGPVMYCLLTFIS